MGIAKASEVSVNEDSNGTLVVGIVFNEKSKVYLFNPKDFKLNIGDVVVVKDLSDTRRTVPVVLGNTYVRSEDIVQPYLGISMINVADAYYSRNYYTYLSKLNVTSGVLVTTVEDNSDADKAGVKPDDIIIEMDGKQISSLAYLRYNLYNHSIGDKVKIKVNRNGNIKELTVTLKNKKSIK